MKEVRRLFLALVLALLPALPVAQGIGPQLPGTATTSNSIDFEEWHRVATRTERAAESGVASIFALEVCSGTNITPVMSSLRIA